jgi:DNA-binding IclR family transcriptional regulator
MRAKGVSLPDGVGAVDRALSILVAFGPADDALTLAELSARTTLYKSTLLRLARSLTRFGLLVRLADGRFRVGPAALRLGSLYQATHVPGEILLPVLRALAAAVGESAAFYVREGDVRVCLHRVDAATRALRYLVAEGTVLPLSAGSGGHVLAAFDGGTDDRADAIRRRMWHASFGDRDPEIGGLSAPVFRAGGMLAGVITIAGPLSRVTSTFADRAALALLDAAAEATRGLGGDARALNAARDALPDLRSAAPPSP